MALSLQSGQSAHPKFTITNTGNEGATFAISAGLTTSPTPGAGSILIGGSASGVGLMPGESTTVVVPFSTIPSGTQPGHYYLHATLNWVGASGKTGAYALPQYAEIVAVVATPAPGGTIVFAGWSTP